MPGNYQHLFSHQGLACIIIAFPLVEAANHACCNLGINRIQFEYPFCGKFVTTAISSVKNYRIAQQEATEGRTPCSGFSDQNRSVYSGV